MIDLPHNLRLRLDEQSAPFYGESGRCYARGWNKTMAYVRGRVG